MWRDLGAALALMLVLEGILPFLSPAGLRRLIASVNELSDGQLRAAGLVSMAAGLALLYILR
ncbi:MAG: hypothetical protein AMJ84_10655 [Acidithiobacillales bacterium SM23_46]|jgi:uncharacterized protein YjeT (DUF2065 family)|nr:MAG: hypothetical protein AMJ84_10655 [Acidithiobacillales bacterium SM23_46]KPL28215.1 MAG: hypothetical protein AMJ72_04610 [Acidithiobacillales bacterium SM1_46]